MPETGETPAETTNTSQRNLWKKFKTAKNIALSGNYARDVAPEEYEHHVRQLSREKLAGEVTRVVREYIPTTRDDSPTKVLDIAAGTGIISRSLKADGYEVTAGDLSEEALAFLRGRDADIQSLQLNMNEHFELPDNSFDGATTVWANRFIKPGSSFLNEVHRVLKPGGVFVWPIFPSERAIWKLNTWKLKGNLGQHTTRASLTTDAEIAGFKVIASRKPPLLKNLVTRSLPAHTTPGYLVLQKAG